EHRRQLQRALDGQALMHFTRRDHFRGGDAMSAAQQFLENELEVPLMLQQTGRMANRMNQPGGCDAELPFLITPCNRVGLFEPFGQGRIGAVDQLAPREETVAKSRSRRPFDHALEAAPWDELRMRVHSLLDQSAEYARVFAVGPQALGDTILFDQPERDRV